MSRHQAIRNLDLNEELADYEYEYNEYSDEGEQMSQEDKVQMAAALAQVKATIGEVPGCSNKAIEDILWDYYYDVPKTIHYILDTYRPATPQHTVKEKKKKQSKAKGQLQANSQKKGLGWTGYQGQFSELIVPGSSLKLNALRWDRVPVGFWDDAPWGAISSDRRANIVIEPIHPRGGLLGGSGVGKTSKLAALAKARKAAAEKKQQESSAGNVGKEEKGAVGLLSKLAEKKGPVSPTTLNSPVAAVSPVQALDDAISTLPAATEVSAIEPTATASPALPPTVKKVAEQIRLACDLPTAADYTNTKPGEKIEVEEAVQPFVVTPRASPSSFAVSMFGERIVKPYAEKITNATLFYYSATVNAPPAASSNAFAEPSPDDKVLAAQSQVKGSVTIFLGFFSRPNMF
ncbi:hypothetical protein L211DRAFT_799898 [Terfezia boudieri ATCC MYA-4762]|uniref:HBS1-like protein N-terminal domain-containing protein n=1 Tax=Terfezia boudieri ATCC MYA-4762 TaxID=1051890 RepID=A0A3N4M2X8_9PEZI|nr:hypothetical protein L211DRAFT_799898 [Terfezia boudieri ATCC MYA-4762]